MPTQPSALADESAVLLRHGSAEEVTGDGVSVHHSGGADGPPLGRSGRTPTVHPTKMPPAIAFIIGNEFCERFSFYGIKAILFVYLRNYLQLDAAEATETLHIFVMLAYFFPLLGGMLSDSYLGKFRTILYLSLVYCTGNIILSVTAIPGVTGGNPLGDPPVPAPHWWGVALGLVWLAVGTGGIKPCVSAFGGDQFDASQTHHIQFFFSMFYFSINAGSVLSMFFTPVLREVKCLGMSSCYPLAFGVPSLLMIVATVIFAAGKSRYRIVPPGGNVVAQIFRICTTAINGRRRARQSGHYVTLTSADVTDTDGGDMHGAASIAAASPITVSEVVAPSQARISDATDPAPPLHWLDYAVPAHGRKMVSDVKAVFGVLYMFLPLPLFWTLYDQTASRWVGQGQHMSVPVVWGFQLKAEQMQITNSILVLLMVPLFEQVVYPAVRRCGFPFRPLQRMVWGMAFVGAAFIVAGVVQLRVEESVIAVVRGEGAAVEQCVDNCISIVWQLPQYVLLTAGEVLFSVTGLEFAYSQAPAAMKSVMTAAWLLTVAVGNLVVVVITGSRLFERESVETFFFAAMVFGAAAIFAAMSLTYRYAENGAASEEDVRVNADDDDDDNDEAHRD